MSRKILPWKIFLEAQLFSLSENGKNQYRNFLPISFSIWYVNLFSPHKKNLGQYQELLKVFFKGLCFLIKRINMYQFQKGELFEKMEFFKLWKFLVIFCVKNIPNKKYNLQGQFFFISHFGLNCPLQSFGDTKNGPFLFFFWFNPREGYVFEGVNDKTWVLT